MTTQTQVQADRSNLLRRTLQTNGVFSSLSGLLFILAAAPIAALMGVGGASIIILLIGVGLLGFAAALLMGAARPTLDPNVGRFAFVADVVWVAASWLVLVTDAFGLTTEGRWGILLVADVVLVFAVLEYIGLRRMR